ncbi:hypothetical protein CMI47_20930 [Candidatus Pacearchaeota archaeon]|jgi:hypothetical protein|nr:hypothetical protein [Candidatus Pacearchaeota archaeon]|tara:strand:- start:4780 stop:5202 length:423 start_codon:yes stop_codon:yes gene_type:complete
MMNKKALSNIVAVSLIILLSIAAISLLSVYVFDIIKSPALSPEYSCLNLQLEPPIQIQKACYSSETSEIQLTLKRSSDDLTIDALDFILDNEAWCCGVDCPNCEILSQDTTKTYYFPETSDSISLTFQNCLLDEQEIQAC